LDLRIKSYGCLKFFGEVWAGRACAEANEEELTTCAKIWGQRGRKEGARGRIKGDHIGAVGDYWSEVADRSPTSGCQLLVVPDQATAGRSAVARPATAARGERRLAVACRSRDATSVDRAWCFLINFFGTFFFSFQRPVDVVRAWPALGGVYTTPPFFEACPYT
jgi:hypothetical protein